MVSVPSPFGGAGDAAFDGYDEFVPANVPEAGPFLDCHDVLAGRFHLAFHRLSRELFEERAVYDMTFGYNLARLNCDARHPDAGYRYAEECDDAEERDAEERDDENREGDNRETDDGAGVDETAKLPNDARVLRAEFWPTTPFCPQSDTLTKGSFRAWNGLADRHEYDLVRVRVAPMHQRSVAINGELRQLEAAFLDARSVPDATDYGSDRTTGDRGPTTSDRGPTPPY